MRWSCSEPRSFCFFLLYGKKYVAKIPAEYDARAGEVCRLYFDVTAIHLFDCDSEMRI